MDGGRIPAEERADFAAFARTLASLDFSGELSDGIAPRLLAATDNSIYQIRPALVLHPRTGSDLNAIVRAARSTPGPVVPLAARGGGTGTNGQSLTRGVVVDLSRHMNRILRIDAPARCVTVEPGVVLDQLNAALAPHGLFFPPSVSTATRATIGGMVATDASGKGSRIYGKTSAWIESMDVVLSDGTDWTIRAMAVEEAEAIGRRPDLVGALHRTVLRIVRDKAETIDKVFPDLNRSLTGYNLKGVIRPDGLFDLAFLLAGSEGTLALTKSVTLRLAPLPKLKALLVARYASFDTALRDVRQLLPAGPSAIEVLDDKVLALAAKDSLWAGLEGVLGGAAPEPVMGLNVVEFVGDDETALAAALAEAETRLAASPHRAMDWTLLRDAGTIRQVWRLRETSVGLLGRLGGKRQGTAFVEDTAVPPERLADYVAAFRSLLDRHGLAYGMFGHADVGCLHVRPALDMTDPADARMIRLVSDEVAALTKSYGGLLWGEHGRGFRGEYSPLFFGPELYPALEEIKAAFDPEDMFNPGKLASPDGRGRVDRIDGVPMRGEADRAIDAARAAAFDRALACNGNAACHSWALSEPMCPSYQATRDRVQSPKGRAAMLREWARLASERDRGAAVEAELAAVTAELKATLDTCLSCQACTSQCPVKVDVPAMRSRFLSDYHRTRPRLPRDRVMGAMERALPLARRFPRVVNGLLSAAPVRRALERHLGLVDLPKVRPARPVRGRGVAARAGRIVLLSDGFTASFDGAVHDAAAGALERLGYEVVSSPVWETGKAEHVLGMSDRFARKARRAQAMRLRLGAGGAALVSLDAATGLLFEREYQAYAPEAEAPRVYAIEAFLADAIERGDLGPAATPAGGGVSVYLHCTERTARPKTGETWRQVLAHFGIAASVPALGCCGMAGMFGHEAEHADLSRRIFDLGWGPSLRGPDKTSGRRAGEGFSASERSRAEPMQRIGEHRRRSGGGKDPSDRPREVLSGPLNGAAPAGVLATGFSCRCQTERFAGFRPVHPIEAIFDRLKVPSP